MQPRDRLRRHLELWLGAWPPPGPGVTVIGSERRVEPGWDGRIRPVAGVATPDGTVLSVPPDRVDAVRKVGSTLDALAAGLAHALDLPGWRFNRGIFRWSEAPVITDAPGTWISPDDPRAPEWLRPFNASVLVGFSGGSVTAGVGRKVHDRFGQELAVVTEPDHRGRGWARRLVAQAAHQVLEEGAVPTYLHGPGNEASSRTADATGFPDRGWKVIGLFPGLPR